MHESHDTRNPFAQDGNDTQHPKKRLWLWRILVFLGPLLVLAGAGAGFAAMGKLKPEPEEKEDAIRAVPVLTAAAYQDDVTLTVNVQGEVQPRTEINLVPQVSGKIAFMSAKFIEGGRFTKGDLLARIDPAEFELRVIQARANVAQAQTVITREQSESQIAARDWEELGRAGQPTPLTLREPQLAEARAQLAAAQARLAEAELELARTSLAAPFTGRVTTRHVDQGEFVTAGTKLGQIYSTDIMDVRLPMTNEDLRRAGLSLGYAAPAGSAGIPVTLNADIAGTLGTWQGHIVRTDSRFDAQTRVLFAYAEVKNPFGPRGNSALPLAPGLFVTAAIDGKALDNTLIIPRRALRGEDTVYLANADDTLSIRTVSVLASDRDRAILGGGLQVGDAVITSPIRGVADGMKIEIVAPAGDTP